MYDKIHYKKKKRYDCIHHSQDMETTYVSINRGMDEEDMVRVHNGILLSHRRSEVRTFVATLRDLEVVILSETSQTETDTT